jgi:dephospho-CoA kinase
MERLVVAGHGRHGKDTVSEILRDRYGFSFISSSEFVGKHAVYPTFKDRYGYASIAECYADRHNHRQEWYELISEYNAIDPAKLGRELFEQFNIYCGIRSRRELDAIKAEKLCDCVVWVDASLRVKPEDASSITVGPDQADYVIDNNSDLNHLVIEVDRFVRELDNRYV